MSSEGGGQGLERELQKASLNRDEPVQLSSGVCRVDTQRQNRRQKKRVAEVWLVVSAVSGVVRIGEMLCWRMRMSLRFFFVFGHLLRI